VWRSAACIQERANYNECNENVTDASIKKGGSVASGGWENETRPVDDVMG
jgi:hypothetical protein